MQAKEIKGRIVLKHDTAANWKTAGDNGFCPLANEIIMFDPDDSCAMIRYKIGRWANNEKTELVNINDLPFESNVYVGRDEPVNAPVGFIWVDTSDEVTLITFKVRNNPYRDGPEYFTYQAEEGMTFRQWVNSQYNVDGWRCYSINIDGDWVPEIDDASDHVYGLIHDEWSSNMYGPEESLSPVGCLDCDSIINPDSDYYMLSAP